MRFFLMSQGSFDPNIRFIGQKVCSVARMQIDRQTDTKVNTEDTLSGFQEFSFNLSSRIGPIELPFFLKKKLKIKDRFNKGVYESEY